jgi:hypothetical protein
MFAQTAAEPVAESVSFRKGSGSGRQVKAEREATDKQKAFLRTLLAERDGNADAEVVRVALNAAREVGPVSAKLASASITRLLEIPKGVVLGDAPPIASAPVKRNLYAGPCNACGRRVAAEAGFVQKGDEGKWVVWHEVCPTSFPFPEGRYALLPGEETDGEGGIRFYHLVDGEVFVMASDNEFPVSQATAERVIAEIAFDPAAASARYGREIGQCGVCHRTLTNEASREAGIGPVCANKAFG